MKQYYLLILLFCTVILSATEEIKLQSPLSTVWTAPQGLDRDAYMLAAHIYVPKNAPADLACGAFVADRDLYWYQHVNHHPLKPGLNHVHFVIGDYAKWQSDGGIDTLDHSRMAELQRCGIFFYSTESSSATIKVDARIQNRTPNASQAPVIDNIRYPGINNGKISWTTGERWHLRYQARVMPSNPYDPEIYSCDLVINQNNKQISIPGFYQQPLTLIDVGDKEKAKTNGSGFFEIRWRPSQPGDYQLTLVVRNQHGTNRISLPLMQVTGEPSDQIIKVDKNDKRFLSTGDGEFYWPVGQNISAVSDDRAGERYKTKPTPKRGTFAYDAYFQRLAANGVNAVEIWMSTWNASLEWSPDRPHYFGLGRYNQFHAARLDRMLDSAWNNKIRLVLNLRNHGQLINPRASESEWEDNPYNKVNGGPCTSSDRFFDNETAWRYQSALRRYIVARYADHPGVLCWKLWSEVDLTDAGIRIIRRKQGRIDLLANWHKRASDEWHQLDHYDHPVATHFATDMHNADPRLCRIPEIDMVLLDAYHHPKRRWQARTLGGLMADSLYHYKWGCAQYNKPVFVTEYGGALGDQDNNKLLVEHQTGRWQALVSGHAAAPMLWWHEWVDQGEHFQAFQAVANFVKGEDLRGAKAKSIVLAARSNLASCWCRAWVKPGVLLAYAQDLNWAKDWGKPPSLEHITVSLPNIKAGRMQVEWWNAFTGQVIDSNIIDHPGGSFELKSPKCSGHIALKLKRADTSQEQ